MAATRSPQQRDRSRDRAYSRQAHEHLRDQFFAAYGAKCVGTSDGEPCQWQVEERLALTIGHMLNDGAAHRARVGNSTHSVIRDLRRRGWPQDEGIAAQCANCQTIDQRTAPWSLDGDN